MAHPPFGDEQCSLYFPFCLFFNNLISVCDIHFCHIEVFSHSSCLAICLPVLACIQVCLTANTHKHVHVSSFSSTKSVISAAGWLVALFVQSHYVLNAKKVSYLLFTGRPTGIDGTVEQHVTTCTLCLLPSHPHGSSLLIIYVHCPYRSQRDWFKKGNTVKGNNTMKYLVLYCYKVT